MKKENVYSFLLIFILSLNLGLIFLNNNFQSHHVSTRAPNNSLNATGINVINSGNLNISAEDPTNHTISWTLTDNGSYDYLGVYSFTEDLVGADPSGWIILEDMNTNVSIIEEIDGHRKVMQFDDNMVFGAANADNLFGNHSSGTIEMWVYGDAPISDQGLKIYVDENGTYPIYTIFQTDNQKLVRHNGTHVLDICNLSNQAWHHLRYTFECGSDGYDGLSAGQYNIYVDGVKYGPFNFRVMVNVLAYLHFASGSTANDGNTYIDAVDYSWATGYYPNRNMDTVQSEARDYLGAYSFTDDADGSNPVGWATLEPVGTNIAVAEMYENHNKVLLLDDDSYSTRCYTNNDFAAQTAGTIEFWFLMPDVSTPAHFQMYSTELMWWSIYLAVSYDLGGVTPDYLAWNDGSIFHDITQLLDNTWYHLRITFECGTGNYDNLSAHTFNIYLNGVRYGPFDFYSNEPNISRLRFNTYDSPYQPSELYLDAVDYSWAPGYYPNRNMDFNLSSTSLLYAVYENDTRMTNWQNWRKSVQVDYNVSGTGLGAGMHNISLVYNDGDGNWYHDDVIVTVSSITQLTIISDAVDFDISGNRKCDVSIKLNNSGSTILTNINFTIEVPAGWSADLHMRTISQLAPGEVVTITYKLTAPETYEAEDIAIMTINIAAKILGTGQIWSDSLTFYVIGINPGLPIWIWIIIVIGSAAAATTSFVFVRRRRIESGAPKYKQISKGFGDLKQRLSTEFPGSYTIISVELMARINQIAGLKDTEKELLLQDVMHMREEDAEKWIDEFEKTLLN